MRKILYWSEETAIGSRVLNSNLGIITLISQEEALT